MMRKRARGTEESPHLRCVTTAASKHSLALHTLDDTARRRRAQGRARARKGGGLVAAGAGERARWHGGRMALARGARAGACALRRPRAGRCRACHFSRCRADLRDAGKLRRGGSSAGTALRPSRRSICNSACSETTISRWVTVVLKTSLMQRLRGRAGPRSMRGRCETCGAQRAHRRAAGHSTLLSSQMGATSLPRAPRTRLRI